MSTTYAPPNIDRFVPSAASVRIGMNATRSPTPAICGTAWRAASFQMRSTTSAIRVTAVRTITGASAW